MIERMDENAPLGCNETEEDSELLNKASVAKDFSNETDRLVYSQVKDYPK